MKEFESMHRAIMDFRKIADGIDSAKDPKTYDLYQTILEYATGYAETVVKDQLELMVDRCTDLRQACYRCKYCDECAELRSLALECCGSVCPIRWTAKGIQAMTQAITRAIYVQPADGGEEDVTKDE